MPKHVFEGKDPLKFDYNPPVTLGPTRSTATIRTAVVHLAEARRLATHLARPLRRTRAALRHLSRPRPAGQARDRAAQPRPRHHPRHLAGRRLHAGEGVAHVQGLVRRLPLRPSRSDAAAGDLQPPEPEVPGQRCALGPGAGARHQGDLDGLLSRRRDDLGDRGSADRHASGLLSQADAGVARRLRARHRQAGDQALRPDDRPADRRHAAAVVGRPRSRPTDARSAPPSGSAGGSRTYRGRASCWNAPASPAAATTGTCRTASASRSRWWSRARRAR